MGILQTKIGNGSKFRAEWKHFFWSYVVLKCPKECVIRVALGALGALGHDFFPDPPVPARRIARPSCRKGNMLQPQSLCKPWLRLVEWLHRVPFLGNHGESLSLSIHIYIYMYIYIDVYIYIYIYTYTDICIHTRAFRYN